MLHNLALFLRLSGSMDPRIPVDPWPTSELQMPPQKGFQTKNCRFHLIFGRRRLPGPAKHEAILSHTKLLSSCNFGGTQLSRPTRKLRAEGQRVAKLGPLAGRPSMKDRKGKQEKFHLQHVNFMIHFMNQCSYCTTRASFGRFVRGQTGKKTQHWNLNTSNRRLWTNYDLYNSFTAS